MKAYHACGLAGLTEQQQWFMDELEGYPPDRELPWYRRDIPGQLVWQLVDPAPVQRPSSDYVRALSVTTDQRPPELEPPEPTTANITVGIEQVLTWAEHGLRENLNEHRLRGGTLYPQNEVRVALYHPQWFQRLRRAVENGAFAFASSTHINLSYGDAVQGIWETYRTDVDAALHALQLEGHFAAIRDNIASANPEHWRQAMWSCRDVLYALAAHLWRDPKDTYAAFGRALGVRVNSPINRLVAYLHCKGVTGQTRKYIEEELQRIGSVLHALDDLDNRAHNPAPVDREDALLAVVGTYTMLSQFARRTDLQPVKDQDECQGN